MVGEKKMHTIEAGADAGKVFVITKMDAFRVESWSMRALLALMNAGTDIPEDVAELGAAAMAELGMKALSGLKWDVLEPLLKEMLECVSYVPDARKTHVSRALVASDIESPATIFELRKEWWFLHMSFFESVAPSIFAKGEPTKEAAVKARVTRISRS